METEVLKDESVTIEVGRFETTTGPRLMIRSPENDAEIYLDPFELEGLARAALYDGAEDRPDVKAPVVFMNEFAMVEVGHCEMPEGLRLFIRDAASGAEVILEPKELEKLTLVTHDYFGPLLDPSDLIAEAEPDPDQV